MNNGFVYVVTGEECKTECIRSIVSLRKYDKNSHITVFTDETINGLSADQIVVDNRDLCPYQFKLDCLSKTPYENTFYLDTDTYFCDYCTNGFNLLKYFDICMAQAPAQTDIFLKNQELTGVAPPNSGVIIYNKKVSKIFDNALTLYKFNESISSIKVNCNYCVECIGDQPYIYLALLYSNFRIHILPNTWNFRIPVFTNAMGKVKILHGNKEDLKGKNFEEIEKIVNANFFQRGWNPITQNISELFPI